MSNAKKTETTVISKKDVGQASKVLGDPVKGLVKNAALKFGLKPVKKKPSRRYRKGSKYDPIIEAFLKGTDKLVKIGVEGKNANYIRTQLNKRIDARELEKKIKVSVVNDLCYMEKI